MSTGFNNNNYGNINYYGTDWEGSTGQTTTTSDGEKNIIFRNGVYSIRALMEILTSYIKRYNLANISDKLRRYSPKQSDEDRIKRAVYIANKYFNSALPEDDIINLSDHDILGLTKGIIETEIPEWNKIPSNYYDVALRYYNSGDDTEAATFTKVADNPGSITAGFNIWIILALLGAGAYFFTKKK